MGGQANYTVLDCEARLIELTYGMAFAMNAVR